ncbi:MAG: helix-turn-helix domain-containing protein [Clostridia bacterium]
MLRQLNTAIEYIEDNLCEEIDLSKLATISLVSKDSFIRFFSYITDMTISDYIRKRKLSLAVTDLQNTNLRVIDIAVKYGFKSADSFTKAFVKQHGVTPSIARKKECSVKIYPPAHLYIDVKGAKEMDFRIISIADLEVYGESKKIELGYKSREEQRHPMWCEDLEDVPSKLSEGEWNEKGNTSYDGIWYGIWQDGKYMIAREKSDTKNHNLEKRIIKGGEYAVFKTEKGTLAWEEFPKLFDLIFNSWLPSSGYKQRGDVVIEILHLFTDKEIRAKNKYYEVYLPIENKE